MKFEDQEQQISSRRRQYHPNKLVNLASKTLTKPLPFIIILIAAFVLGYLSHTHPLLSQSAIDLLDHNTFPTKCNWDHVPPPHIREVILSRVFNNTSPWQDFPPKHVSPFLWQEWTVGWGSNSPVFEHLIDQVRPRIIIEVGTFLGASATHMARLTRNLGLDTQIICIDDFRGWPGYYHEEKSLRMVSGDSMLLYQFMQNVAKANATDSILFMPFSAGTALGALCEWGVRGDLVEVDAAHDFHSAWVDINNGFKVLRPGGVIFGHDIVWEGVRKAVHLFARLKGFQVRIDGEHWILY